MGPEGCLLMTIMFNCTQLWEVCFEKFWPHRKKFGWITFIVNLSLYLAFLLPFTALAVYLKANSLELCGYKFENMTKHRTGYYEHTWVSNSLFKCWCYVKEWVPQLSSANQYSIWALYHKRKKLLKLFFCILCKRSIRMFFRRTRLKFECLRLTWGKLLFRTFSSRNRSLFAYYYIRMYIIKDIQPYLLQTEFARRSFSSPTLKRSMTYNL